MPVPVGSKNVQDHGRTPLMVVAVGKWWGLFRVPSLAPRVVYPSETNREQRPNEEPEVLSWHSTEGAATIAASALATYDPAGKMDHGYSTSTEATGRMYFGRKVKIKEDFGGG